MSCTASMSMEPLLRCRQYNLLLAKRLGVVGLLTSAARPEEDSSSEACFVSIRHTLLVRA
jgi:hypothetical protein